MKRELRSKSVGTKVSEAELRVLESAGGPVNDDKRGAESHEAVPRSSRFVR